MTAEIKGLDLRKMKDATAEKSAEAAPRKTTPRVVPIPVEYTDPNGKPHEVVLQNKILDGDERFRQAKMAVDMLMGATWDAMPPLYRQRAYMLSWLVHSLDDPPTWVVEWMQEDVALLMAIYQEVELHELRYFRGVDGAGQPREEGSQLRVTSPFAADAPT